MFLKFFNNTYKTNKVFFLAYFTVLLIGGIFLAIFPKGSFLLFLNHNHNVFFDYFFKIATYLGDGLFILPLLLIFAFVKLRYSILVLASYLLSGGLAQILKRIFDVPRPKVFFAGKELLYFVPGVDVYSYHSFPSGHAATAFSYCLIISIASGSKSLKFVAFLLASFISISRVYLCQHFLIDIYFGSMLGIISTIILDYILGRIPKFNSSVRLNNPLFKNNNS